MSLNLHGGKVHRRLREWCAQPWARFVALTIYYLAILVGLVALYGAGDFSTPSFVYQNF
jgi:gamma-glutamylcysteine synthetase